MQPTLPRPDRTLLWCIALVLLAHAWLLQHLPELLRAGTGSVADAPAPPLQPVLSLRRIEAAPAAPSSAAAAAAAAPAPRPGARVVSPGAATPKETAMAAAREAPPEPSSAASAATLAESPPTEPPATPPPPVTPIAAATPDAATTAVRSEPERPATASSTAPPAAAGSAIGPLAIAGSTRMRYLVYGESRGQPYQVNASLLWQHDGRQYEARLEINAWLLGTRTQTSRGRITAEGIAPQRFGDRFRSERAAHFQRDKGVISFSSNTPDAPLQPGAQDRLSVLLQLGAMIGGDPQRYPAQSVIQIQTAGVRDAEPWSFRVIGPGSLQLPGGPMQAIKLERLPRREYDQHIEVWLAPALEYLPVRVRITQGNGDVVDQQWLARDSL